MSIRFAPTPSKARILSGTGTTVPTSSRCSAHVPKEYSRAQTYTSRFECLLNVSSDTYPGEPVSMVVMRSNLAYASASMSRMMT